MNYNTTNVLEYDVFSDSLDKIDIFPKDKLIINTINPHSYICAQKDNLFHIALQKSHILLPDGIGIVYASTWLNKIKIARITGYDLLIQILKKLNELKGKCFFMGTNDATLQKIKDRIRAEFPNIKVSYYAPLYKKSFNKDENKCIIENINTINPDVLFVGLTAPKQELWVHKNKSFLNTKVICSIGAVFDFYSETRKRPHDFWQHIGLEWLIRFFLSPLRLWRRNFISAPLFIMSVIKVKINSYKL